MGNCVTYKVLLLLSFGEGWIGSHSLSCKSPHDPQVLGSLRQSNQGIFLPTA